MQFSAATYIMCRTPRVLGIARFCAIVVVLLAATGCSQSTSERAENHQLSVDDLGATARTVAASANRALPNATHEEEALVGRTGAEGLVAYPLPIPLPSGVIVGHSPPHWWGSSWDRERAAWIKAVLWVLYSIVALICVYAVRHYWFTYNRLFAAQRHTYLPIDVADWPRLTVLIPCHNEERVVASILEALLRADYPVERLKIVPVNDRSTDATAEIIDRFAASFPGRVMPLHRTDGKPGKAAALQSALEFVDDDIILVFDADYLPGKDLIKRLAAPFLDPQVGAVMGRVVPVNTPRNLLTRLLDLERAGGYQVDQQARMNLKLIAQYGGTVGGVRVSALDAVGGWREDSLAEDTDITFRLVLGGWKIAYSNRYECYEEVPENWPVRIRQIMRWARGHTDAAMRYLPSLIVRRHLTFRERLDGALLLGTYLMSPILLVGWFLAILAFYLGANPFLGAVAIFSVAAYNTIGNFAAFFEIGAAAHLDGTERRIRILPLVLGGFLVSLVSTSRAVLKQLMPSRKEEFHWDKTERYRSDAPIPTQARAIQRKPAAAAAAPDRAAVSPPRPAAVPTPATPAATLAATPATPAATPATQAATPATPAATPATHNLKWAPLSSATHSVEPEQASDESTPAKDPSLLAPNPQHEPRRKGWRPLDATDRPPRRSTTGHQISVPRRTTE